MADVTFYFPSTGAAAHDCGYSDYWTNTTGAAHLPLLSSKGTSAMAGRNAWHATGQNYCLAGQWVSAAMAARSWTPYDTFDYSMIFRDQNYSTTTFITHLSIRIFNAAGDTEVATLFEGEVNASAWIATYQSRHCDGVALTGSGDMPENGHFVVEVGGYATYAGAYAGQAIFGEGTSTALLLNDTQTNTDLYSWISFTYGEAPATGYINEVVVVFES